MITPNGGIFSDSVSVTIQSATSGSTIYYTTDGSTPTQSSIMYTGAMTLTDNATVNAKAFKSGYNPSTLAAASFTNTVTNTVPRQLITSAKMAATRIAAHRHGSQLRPNLLSAPRWHALVRPERNTGAGYTVNVAAGTYTESIIDKIPSGSGSSNQFTLQCATDFACVLSPGGTNAAIGINTPTHWITVRGFKTTSGGGWYLSAYPTNRHHHISFINNEWVGSTMHPTAMGIQVSSTGSLNRQGKQNLWSKRGRRLFSRDLRGGFHDQLDN